MQPPAEKPKSELLEASVYNKFLCLQYRIWWYVLISLLILQWILMLGTLGSYNWVGSGDGDAEWKGSLMVVTSGPDIWEDMSYEDLIDDYCEDDDSIYDGYCELFSEIYSGGVAYIFFEVFAMTGNAVWIVKVMYLILERPLGPNWLPYVINLAVLIFHLIALVAWFGSTSASFGSSCDEVIDGSDRGDLCATSGAALSVFVMILFIVITVIFLPLYITRHRNSKHSDSLSDGAETETVHNLGSSSKSQPKNIQSDRV